MHFFIDNCVKYPHTNRNRVVTLDKGVRYVNKNKLSKGICMFLCMLLCVTMISGCNDEKAPDTVSTIGSSEEHNTSESLEDGIYIMLYMLNENSWDTEIDADVDDADAKLTTTIVAEISEKDLNAETIVEKYNEIVVQSLYGEVFAVNAVTKTNDSVIIDFDAASVEAIDIVEGEEGQLFYNLARSIDDNLDDVNFVYFTMDGGKDFQLGHLWFAAEEPFYSGRRSAE